jgi:hypothetical protein
MWTAFEQSTDRIVAAEESSLILILKKEIEKLRGRLKAYEDTGLTPEEVSALVKDWSDLRTIVGECGGLDRVRALAKADRDGRLVVLPCQSGEHVFALLDNQTHVWECEVEHAVLDGWRKVFAIRPLGHSKESYYAPFGAFGQSVFLTREEAERALEAKKDE